MNNSTSTISAGWPTQWPANSFRGGPTALLILAALGAAIVGGPHTVGARLESFVESTKCDELMIATDMYEHAKRVRSYEIVAREWELVR